MTNAEKGKRLQVEIDVDRLRGGAGAALGDGEDGVEGFQGVDGAGPWQILRDITLPLILPFIMVAVVLRTIDALKAFDTIFTITQGGPGTASETINIYLYLQAFSFFRIGHASAVVMVFFVIIVACSLSLLVLRQRMRWT